MTVSKLVGSGLLAGFLLVLIPLAKPLMAEQSCTATCSGCAKHLGGTGVAGPYPNPETCKAYVEQMRKEGFPFDDCKCEGTPLSSAEDRAASKRFLAAHPIRTGVLFAAALAPVGWAVNGATSSDSKAGAEGAAAGAAAGFVIGFGLSKIAAVETKFAPVFADIATHVAFAPISYSSLQGHQRHGFLIRIRWALR
jgi:hypothetical protein